MAETATIRLPDGRTARLTGPDRETIMAKAQRLVSTMQGDNNAGLDVPQVSASGEVAPAQPSPLGLLQRAASPPEPFGSTAQAVAAGAGEQLYGNILGIPDAALRMLNPAANLARRATGQPERPAPSFGLLSGRQAAAGAEVPGAAIQSLLGDREIPNIPELYQERIATRERLEQERPGATGVGELLGDAGTLAMGRAPMVRGPGGLFDESIERGLTAAATGLARGQQGKIGPKRLAERVIRSDLFKGLSRGGGRAVETGIEGMALSLIQDGDPVATAGMAAGGQLAASGALSLASEGVNAPYQILKQLAPEGMRDKIKMPSTIQGKIAGAVGSAIIAGGMLQMFKEATPGGQDRILESDEAGYKKIAASILLGATAGMLGKRSKAGGILEQFPKLADAATTLPRTGIIKLAQAASEDPDIERTLNSVTSNPSGFTRREIERFNDAARSDDPAARVREMLEDDGFREKISAPHPKLIGVPVEENE